MVVDRIERHDVVNAVLLAAVLLLLGWGVTLAVGSLFSTLDEGVIESTKNTPAVEPDEAPAGASTDDDPAAATDEPTTSLPEARPPAEVAVRVANGARRPGVAGAGTELLQNAGYDTLDPKNGPTLDESVVYYGNGYAADAAQVAITLGLDAAQIAPMPSDPGVAIDEADVIAVLGVTSEF